MNTPDILFQAFYRASRGCTRIFDFPLFYALRDMTNAPEQFDMRDLLRRRLPERDMAVPFVGSHDVSRNENAIRNNVPLAYALILAMTGTPCVYYSDLWRTGKHQREALERLMRARRLAVGAEITRWEDDTVLALEREGSLLAAFHSGRDAEEKHVTVDTSFGPHVRLRDQAGDGKPVETDENGRVTLTLEPHSYAYYAPLGRRPSKAKPKPLPTRQVWEFAADLFTGRLTADGYQINLVLDKGQSLRAALALDGDALGKMTLELDGKAVASGDGSTGAKSMPEDGVYVLRVQTAGDTPTHGTLTVER